MSRIIITPELCDSWLWEDPTKFQWWLKLLMLACVEAGTVTLWNGELVECARGEIITSLSALAKEFKTSKDNARNFINQLTRTQMASHCFYTTFTRITICNYDSYIAPLHYFYTTPQDGYTTNESVTNCDTGICKDKKTEVTLPPSEEQENKKEKEKKEAKKRINKKQENFFVNSSQSSELTSPSARTREEKTLITRAREIFEEYYEKTYGQSYYWEAKDAKNMGDLLRKITFSRKNRKVPLPVDDDSILDAFKTFLESINKNWIHNNFSVPKINSQYNDIISEIKNRKPNEQQGFDNNYANIICSTRQKESVLSDLARAEQQWLKQREESDETT